MRLYYTKSSPFSACVRAIIIELDATKQVEMIESHPFEDNSDFLAANPLGKVPCLIDNVFDESIMDTVEQPVLDSEVICDYLDANINSGLLFEAIYADWRLKTFYSICSGLMDCCVHLQMEKLRSQDGLKSEFWYDRHLSAIERTLVDVEKKLVLLPENFTVLHINLFCTLAYLDFRHTDISWRDNHGQLVEFFESMKNRECFIGSVYS